MTERYYTVDELAKMFAWSEGHVRNMIHIGKIPAVKVLGSVRIKAEDVEKIIRPKEVKRPAKEES